MRAARMRYYEGHEAVYRRLRAAGSRAWDEYLGQAPDFDSFCLGPFIEEAISRSTFADEHPRALEVGCGTGPVCCRLAERGFRVEGVDVSETALAIAREESSARGLEITYRVLDVCKDDLVPEGDERVDVAVDGHFLHCIVLDEHRARALASIRRAIRPGGYFWVDTMLASDATDFGKDRILDEEGVLWVKISESGNFDVERRIDGDTYVANRRLQPSGDRMTAELRAAGFAIAWSEVVPPRDASAAAAFRAVCNVD